MTPRLFGGIFVETNSGTNLNLDDRDLDIIRGWAAPRDERLRAPHILPTLARLTNYNADQTKRQVFDINGPETYVGRFHPQQGPIDVLLNGFDDHEIYKCSAPHIRLTLENNMWFVRPTAPVATTEINGERLRDTQKKYPVSNGDVISMGCLDFVFETGDSYNAWLDAKKELFKSATTTTLFLMRHGGAMGASIEIGGMDSCTIGRGFPTLGQDWKPAEQPDWDLGFLFEHEAKFVGFRHIEIFKKNDDWRIKPLTNRQRTYVNRLEISGTKTLMPGDEIGLGTVLIHFHDPSDLAASTQSRTAELPTVLNWTEEHTSPRVQPLEPAAHEALAAERIAQEKTEMSDENGDS